MCRLCDEGPDVDEVVVVSPDANVDPDAADQPARIQRL